MIPQHSSETNEQYSPEWLVRSSHEVYGGFLDLDPASSHFANQLIGARCIYTAEDNGLWQNWDWAETIFNNPPGGLVDENGRTVIRASKASGRKSCVETGSCGLPPGHKHKGVTSSAATWWHKLGLWWNTRNMAGQRATAICVLFSLELLQTVQQFKDVPHPLDFTGCLPRERVDFDVVVEGRREPQGQPTHANLIVLLSNDWNDKNTFHRVFSTHGKVFVPGRLR